jgi:hypothetical protein
MANRSFTVTALWDSDAKVFISESDIIGLHVEADTLEEFEAIVKDVAPDLVIENHLKPDLGTRPLLDLIPSIFVNRPAPAHS